MKDYPSAFRTVRIRHCLLKGNGSAGATSDKTPVQNISLTTDVRVSPTFIVSRYFNNNILLKSFILFFLASINIAFADPLPARTAQQAVANSKSSIEGAFENVSGIARVNVTAGTGNLQQNSNAFAILSDSQLNAMAKVKSTQLTDNPASKNPQLMSAEIGPGAFNGARGITSVNQSAGADNAQLNAMAVAVGGPRPFAIVEMNESQLLGESQAAGFSLADQAGNTAQVNAATGLSKSAFNGARGVIQINQAAGIGNLTSNSFTMSVSK